VWNGKIVVSRAGAISREKAKATDKPTPGDYAWGLTVSKSRVVAAMALAENAALFAGHVRGAPAGSGGFLWVVSSADGREIARFTLDAPAVHDGLAVAGGRAYVSRRDGTVVCLGAAD